MKAQKIIKHLKTVKYVVTAKPGTHIIIKRLSFMNHNNKNSVPAGNVAIGGTAVFSWNGRPKHKFNFSFLINEAGINGPKLKALTADLFAHFKKEVGDYYAR